MIYIENYNSDGISMSKVGKIPMWRIRKTAESIIKEIAEAKSIEVIKPGTWAESCSIIISPQKENKDKRIEVYFFDDVICFYVLGCVRSELRGESALDKDKVENVFRQCLEIMSYLMHYKI
jgi:hypothetical protein